ncbi:MAG: iron-containing alcohol dehydrogenase [Bacteroidota bacterium]
MENFDAYNPTRLHFGKGVISGLGKIISQYGSKILLVYGKGSIRKNGIYDEVMKALEPAKAEIIEFSGIKSNPLVDDVDKATALGIEKNIDIVLAVGGGSVIDSAKIISLCIHGKHRGWDVMKNKVDIKGSIPLIGILTLAATGTEMNPVAVLQNQDTKEKIGYRNQHAYPSHSFLDPSFTISVPRDYTAYGAVDLVAHCLEIYYGAGDCPLSDRLIEGIIKEGMEAGPLLLKDLSNYDLRARIMWAATNALNGLTAYGKESGDWGVHAIGHVLSLLYDVPHGASLSIAYPAWLKLHLDRIPDRIAKMGNQVFGHSDAERAIADLEAFFYQMGSPVKLSEYGIGSEKHPEILKIMNQNKISGMAHELTKDDHVRLISLME